jgi:hypothetical protein
MDNQPPNQPPVQEGEVLPPGAQTQPPVSPVGATSGAKKPFPTLWLVLWLAAWPTALVLSVFTRFMLGGDIAPIFNIFTILIGLYGVVGWIPFVIVLIARNSK